MAERERGYLGMTHNPFAQPSEGFFERGNRKAYLDQLRHLSQWTQRVLLVTGPQGAGKSVLYRRLSAGLEPRAKAARVNGSLVTTAREILAAVAQGYGIAVPGNANTQLLASVIAAHVQDQEAAERPCVTMIDDAESLEPRALEVLVELTLVCSMRLVLFGEPRLVAAVESCSRKHECSWQEIQLAGLSGQDSRDYLEWRFAEAKYRGRLPFTDQQVAEIVRVAEGFPGRMNQLANVLLAKLESGDVRPDRTRFPPVHRALAGLVALLAGLIYLVWFQTRESLQEPWVASSVAAPQIEPEVDLRALAVPEELGAEPEQPLASEVLFAQAEPAPLPGSGADPEVAVVPVAEPEIAVPQPTLADEAQPLNPAAEAPAQRREQWHGEAWLLAQAESAFTIQLVTVSTRQRAEAFLLKQSSPEEFATYRLDRDGRELHVIVFGIFDSQDQARKAAAQLPDSVGDVRPWVRRVGQVQGAITAAVAVP
jgi:type II secretory pathway predicted ATPase ExeA